MKVAITQGSAKKDDSLTVQLAKKILSFDKSQLTPLSIERAKMCILDAVGVMLAGTVEPASLLLRNTPGVASATGLCRIFGTNQKTSALDAALINGTASHALDYDDFSSIMGGHHTVPLMAPLLAIAEENCFSGEQVLIAYIIGVEVEIRFARALGFHHYDKGWHPTSTIGTFGATASLSHLLSLNLNQTSTALSIAASMAAGIKANFGTMVKPLHVGQCARNGLLAVLLAKQGYDANPNSLEHVQGFFNVFNGEGTFDTDKLFEDWALPLEIEGNTIALKQFPCCGSTHPAITMMLQLRQEESMSTEDIEKIEVLPHSRRLMHTNHPFPKTSLEAKFSVQYVTVRALLSGSVRLRDFEDNAFLSPEVKNLLNLIQAHPHPAMSDDADEQWGAEVIVYLKNGLKLSRRIDQLVGRGGTSPMSEQEMWNKFQDCAQRALPPENLEAIFDMLLNFEKVSDINQLTELLISPSVPSRTPNNELKGAKRK
jgi:2-methylcitrate dehydratase PrpD